MAKQPDTDLKEHNPYHQITLGNGVDPAIAILLVEDNPGDVRLLEEFLREVVSAQFALTQTDRLDTAITCLAKNHFDVVLLDLSLPDSQGLETFLALHRHAPDLPIIVLTGLDDETLAMKAMHAGAQDYLPKGEVSGNLLGRSIRYAIERQRADAALRDSEARYRSVVLAMQEGIILQQADGTILTCNASAERILALPVAEILGHTACDLNWHAIYEDGSPFPCESYPAMVTRDYRSLVAPIFQVGVEKRPSGFSRCETSVSLVVRVIDVGDNFRGTDLSRGVIEIASSP